MNDMESQREMLNYREFMDRRQCQKGIGRRCRTRPDKEWDCLEGGREVFERKGER